MVVEVHHMRLCVIGVAQRAIGGVRLQVALIGAEIAKGLLQTIERLGLACRFTEVSRPRNGLVQEMAHGTARGKYAERQRPYAAAEPAPDRARRSR